MMGTDTCPTTDPDPSACLAIVAALLARASGITWNQAKSNPDLHLRFRGLGLDLAASQVMELLPAHTDVDVTEAIQTDPLELMRSAEEALRRHPIENFPAGTSQLVVAIGDLIAEEAQ